MENKMRLSEKIMWTGILFCLTGILVFSFAKAAEPEWIAISNNPESTTGLGGWLLVVSPNISHNNTYYTSDVAVKNTSSEDPYLYNNTNTIFFNETYLNDTIDDRAGAGSTEVDPFWTANQSDYYTSTQTDTEIGNANTSMKGYVDNEISVENSTMKSYVDNQDSLQDECSEITNCVPNALSSELDPFWTANQSDYYTSTQTDTAISTANTSMKGYVDNQDSLQDECSEITNCVPNALSSELDPFWTANVTTCTATQKLYFNAGVLACNDDQVGGGGAGVNYWAVSDSWMYPNTSAGADEDVNVSSINATDWSNVTIIESQISDLQSYLLAELDPFWTANQSDYYTSSETDTEIGNANTSMKGYVDNEISVENTTMKSYVDSQDSLQDECSEITNCVVGAMTEIDAWATDINDYPAACTAGFFVTELGDTNVCTLGYNATQDTVSDCTEADACTIDAESMEGTDWGTLTDGYYCTYDLTGTEVDCATQYTTASNLIAGSEVVADTEVEDDITVTSTKMINTTGWVYATRICLDTDCTIFVNGTGYYQTNGGSTWWFHVNASGDMRIESV
jgi:hypothetical protein